VKFKFKWERLTAQLLGFHFKKKKLNQKTHC
jgi:hypothetical protein